MGKDLIKENKDWYGWYGMIGMVKRKQLVMKMSHNICAIPMVPMQSKPSADSVKHLLDGFSVSLFQICQLLLKETVCQLYKIWVNAK